MNTEHLLALMNDHDNQLNELRKEIAALKEAFLAAQILPHAHSDVTPSEIAPMPVVTRLERESGGASGTITDNP